MSRGGEKMADKNTTSNINLAAAEELPKAQSKFKEFIKKFGCTPKDFRNTPSLGDETNDRK